MLNHAKPNVLLLYPKTGMDFGSSVAPPHALLTIAAPVLEAGYNVKILDQDGNLLSDNLDQMIYKSRYNLDKIKSEYSRNQLKRKKVT